MNHTQTCKSCSAEKSLAGFERLPTGGYRGTCIACRQAAAAARKRLAKAKRDASPEYQARLAKRKWDREIAKAAREAEAAALRAEKAALVEAARIRQEALREAAYQKREERKAALRDELWSAMGRGRHLRETNAVKPRRTGTHGIRLKHGSGYITAAEFACRCAEREATRRAVKTCTTFEAAAAAALILEKGIPTTERTKELAKSWESRAPRRSLEDLQDPSDNYDDPDPWEEALGDWAPAWMNTAGGFSRAPLHLPSFD